MVDIRQFPYFSYDSFIDYHMNMIWRLASFEFISFRRCFPNQQNAFIIYTKNQDVVIDYFKKDYYKNSIFNNNINSYESGFHMWDHITCRATRTSLQHVREKYDLAHGLTIVQQHGTHCDFFVFATRPNNNCINNFYLDKKELFDVFINNFYKDLDLIIKDVSACKVLLPSLKSDIQSLGMRFSPRQQDCARLMIHGFTAKEIARELNLSQRTVEDYIGILRKKAGAKNRAQLVYFLCELSI